MISLLLLFGCLGAALSEDPAKDVVKKQIPIFGPTFQAVVYDEVGRPSYRIFPTPENVYKGVIEKPLVVVSVAEEQGQRHTLQFAPGGLRGLLKDPETKGLADRITKDDEIVVVVYPKTSFPFHFFGETLKTVLRVPEHRASLETLLEQPTLVVLMRKDQLDPLDSTTKLGNIADLFVEGNKIGIGREYRKPLPYYPPPTLAIDSNFYVVYPNSRKVPPAPHFSTPIPALPPLNMPDNVGPVYI